MKPQIKYKCLYEITGCIEDVATFLVPIADLPKQEQEEPVAWIEHEWAGTGLLKLHFERHEPTVRDEVVNPIWTPLYIKPQPSQKPLTDEQKQLKFIKWGLIPANQSWGIQDWFYAGIAYAEAAHGIKENT